jgi:hypothetical protein
MRYLAGQQRLISRFQYCKSKAREYSNSPLSLIQVVEHRISQTLDRHPRPVITRGGALEQPLMITPRWQDHQITSLLFEYVDVEWDIREVLKVELRGGSSKRLQILGDFL